MTPHDTFTALINVMALAVRTKQNMAHAIAMADEAMCRHGPIPKDIYYSFYDIYNILVELNSHHNA
jgi:hypothetical protein